jgi:hypothetical protein
MATDLDSIKQTLVNISKGESLLDTLLEFERTLDNAEIFAYKNWILGELVEGQRWIAFNKAGCQSKLFKRHI